MSDIRLKIKPHDCICGAPCYRISPDFKEEWASGITKELKKIISTVERGLVSHPEPYLLFEIWKIINRAVRQFPNAVQGGKDGSENTSKS